MENITSSSTSLPSYRLALKTWIFLEIVNGKSSKKFTKVQRQWVDSTNDIKTMHFSFSEFCRSATKYKGLSFASLIWGVEIKNLKLGDSNEYLDLE